MSLGSQPVGVGVIGGLAMSRISFTLTGVCSGGNHWTVTASENGGSSVVMQIDKAEVFQPLSEDELKAVTKYMMRNYAKGKAPEQATALFQSGVNATL